ncbi:MAG: toll/interleukin-1 receptor domain-containing protein [Oscillospiraceae bacterium]|nr:toll/interleukin-1 receptor domain-containing protein [Oscillospiraceae bacterium]
MVFEDRRLAPYEGEKPYVFLSYSHENANDAAEIIRRLKEKGCRIWYDEGITPGVEWEENVATHLKNSSFFLALISKAYMQSANCKDELAYARKNEKPTLLVYLEETELSDGLDMRAGRLRALYKFSYEDETAFYEKLVEPMDECRGDGEKLPEPPPPPPPPRKWPFIVLGLVVVAVIAFFALGGGVVDPTDPTPLPESTAEEGITFTEMDADEAALETIPVAAAQASSELSSDGTVYAAGRAVDEHPGTAWIEGAGGDGTGESILLRFAGQETVSVLRVHPGYTQYYESYGRPKTLRFTFSDGSSGTYTLADENADVWLRLGEPVSTETLLVTIEDVYPGSAHDAAAITEISACRYQEAEAPLVLGDAPSAADLDAIGADVVYPRKESYYLKEYEYATTTGSTNAYLNPNAANVLAKDNYFRLKGGTDVIVIAKGAGYSCVIVEATKQAGWIKTDTYKARG